MCQLQGFFERKRCVCNPSGFFSLLFLNFQWMTNACLPGWSLRISSHNHLSWDNSPISHFGFCLIPSMCGSICWFIYTVKKLRTDWRKPRESTVGGQISSFCSTLYSICDDVNTTGILNPYGSVIGHCVFLNPKLIIHTKYGFSPHGLMHKLPPPLHWLVRPSQSCSWKWQWTSRGVDTGIQNNNSWAKNPEITASSVLIVGAGSTRANYIASRIQMQSIAACDYSIHHVEQALLNTFWPAKSFCITCPIFTHTLCISQLEIENESCDWLSRPKGCDLA